MRSIRARFERTLRFPATSLSIAIACSQSACRQSLSAPMPALLADDAAPKRGGTLHLASMGDVRNLDPAGPSDGLAAQAQRLVFAGLVDLRADGTIVPDLAERWEILDGGTTYRFYLRQGVQMQDGEELTADDVERSAERALDPAAPNPDASYFDGLVGYEAFADRKVDEIAGVQVEGRYALSFHLRAPDAAFLSILTTTSLRPVCRSAGRQYSRDWLPCGAGPFRLLAGDWQHGSSLRLVRNDAYFRPGLPHLDAIEWTFNMQVVAQHFRFESGDLDLLSDLTQSDQIRFQRDPRWRAFAFTEADTSVFGESMNTRMAPFDRVEVRRAVAAAIDREHYALLKPADMTVLTRPIPADIPDFDADAPDQRYDYAAALRHMANAGLAYDPVTGRGGWPQPIDYPLYDKGLLVFTAQLLKQDLAKIGLRIELKLVSWPAFLALQERPDGAAMSQGNWQMDYPDPSSFFEPLFTTGSIGAEAGHNTSLYSNPKVDELIAEARREPTPDVRRGLYRRADEIVCDEAPWAFAYSYHAFHVHQPSVRGLATHAYSPLNAGVWLARAGHALERALGTGDP